MKKWIGIFAAVCLVVLLVVSSVAGMSISNKAEPGKICSEGGCLSQVVRADGKDYVIYKNAQQQKFQVVNTGKDYEQYETVGTVHLDRVYYLFRFQNENKVNFGIEPVTLEEEENWQTPLLEAEGTFLAAGSSENEIFVSILGNDGRRITEYALSVKAENGEWRERVVFSLPEGHYAICGAYDGEEFLLVQEDGKVYVRDVVVREADVKPEDSILSACFEREIISGAEDIWKLNCAKNAAVKYLVLVILLSAFIVLLFYGRRRQNHMVYRLIFYTEIIAIAALGAAGYVFTDRLMKQEVMETGIEAGYVLEEMKLNQRADGTVRKEVYWNAVKSREELVEDIVITVPQSGEIILAKTLSAGMKISDYFDDRIMTLVTQVAEGNEAAMMQLKRGGSSYYIVASRDWTQIEAESVLLAVISKEGIEKRSEEIVSSIWDVILLLMIFVTILHMIVFLFFASGWKRFLEGMQFVASEKKAYADRPKKNDGLYSAWAPLDRIGHNIVKLRYERDLLYRSYYRFVPKGMEQLLKKPEVADIEIGDKNKICGCMVQSQMENIKSAEHSHYMNVITESLRLMHQAREKHGGIFISAGGDILHRKVFFEQAPREALQFAVDLCHAHMSKEKLADINEIMMLHQADYHYGVSGVEDMMTPYIYCAEEKILDAYMDALAKARVKIVLTEQTVATVGSGFLVRYIGFVSGGEMTGSIKLYECLDAYVEEKRKVMKESDVFFQKALKMFYSNDFYLARNAFNEVLKMNEQDEIARWYLFHCEYYLNRPEAEVSYGLFERSIREQGYDK